MIYLIISLLNILAAIAFKVSLDKNQLNRGRKIRHPFEWGCMAIANIPAIILLSNQSTIAPYFQFYELSIPFRVPVICVMVAFFIWVIFNGWFNIARMQRWFFTGTLHKGTAITDLFLKWIEKRVGWAGIALVEFVPLILLIFFYIIKLRAL